MAKISKEEWAWIEKQLEGKKLKEVKPGDPDYKFVDDSEEQALKMHKALKKAGLL